MRLRPLLLSTVLLTLPLAAAQAQRADTVDTSLPTQLPRSARPDAYRLTITPDAAKLRFDGRADIDLTVLQPTRTLTLNAADLTIGRASIARGKMAAMPATVSLDEAAQTATFTFARPLTPGRYTLGIDYAGKINTQANGLFALDYTNNEGKPARALFTQFEAADARRMFPGWDEPDYKATFDLTARVPARDLAVGNMPIASTRALPGGLKEVRFGRTPPMSSYLLFLSTGDLERIAMKAGNKEVGVVTSRGNASKARFALESEAQILPYYEQYFDYPFALPKLDNVAGPGQSQFFGAMENWGAIFTFERILLEDPAITTPAERQAIFSVEAHEMAHQWFGDLVTMGWWDDLWLNEGFASWMENRTTAHFHPDWGADVDAVQSREAAIGLDSFRSTHPVIQQVRTVEQANQAFDTITYQKGESVISMLEGFAGSDTWREGLRRYMKTHAFQNTRTDDLWAAVEGAGAKGLTAIARQFTTQPGVPLIRVANVRCEGGRTTLDLQQSQFASDRREEVAARPLSWSVPVRASVNGGPVTQVITAGPTTRMTVPGCGPLLLNAGQTGYYRTMYDPASAAALLGGFVRLSPADQYGELSNANSLSGTGYQPMARALDLLAAVPQDAHGKVVGWSAARWSGLYDTLGGNAAAQAKIATEMQRRFGTRLAQIGLTPRSGEPVLDTTLRPVLISTLGSVGDRTVVAEANRLFAAWQSNPQAIPGSLKSTWLGVVARNADQARWNQLHSVAQRTRGSVERTTYYELLGDTANEALARRTLELALTDEPGKTVSAGMISAVAGEHPELALDFVLAHLAQVNALVDISGRSRFLSDLASGSDDPATIGKLEAYAKANLGKDDRRPIDRAIDRIRTRLAQQGRVKSETAAWLARRS
ncbi:M1 family metallopeptidase [Sphingomonas sp. BN140010]|uniref:Aminopeptidase n=1 Tax=Sphingomonas arvum TaxID=2992113 RepID=A0ABT3JG96_9SPHN|nr:M1 family metallopeptidase [Sphingomonas sp. BN140010]MCW3798029.1 M1 family metallopeptidase [Sphingomonas sp. BN140010]